ncbi:hypothetical protein HJC23_001262 [Cyclotella cryptica]|uniref:SAM-dependent MTase RsmB/NOP-type domain-containing protein n=1 Tax=Cyclotella cryptica TaxID=29204 RepID=A0ABD3PFX3_9STRA
MISPYSAATMGAFLLFSQPTRVKSFSCTIQSNIIAFPSSHAAITRARKRHVFAASTIKDISHPDAQKRRFHSSKTKDNIRPTARFVAIAALSSGSSKKENVDSLAFAARRLEQDERYQRLEPRDRAFARLLVATVERRLGQIDGVLKRCVDKYPPKGKHASLLQATLRIGVAQLLFLNTPPFAANHDTVQVLRINHCLSKNSFPVPEPMIRFVNGVLRKLSTPAVSEEAVGVGGNEDNSKHTTLYGHELLKQTSPDDNIAPWLLERWERDWGESRARLIREEMMPSNNNPVSPRIDVTTKYSLTSLMESSNPNTHQNSRAMLEKMQQDFGDDCILLPQGSLRIGSSLTGDITQWPGYHDGTWWVQDASSTLPALVLTRALSNSRDGEDLSSLHVVDMCAAPGGKTSQLLSAGFGRVTAVEASERRSRRLVENLSRLNLSERCHVIVGDGQNYRPPERDDQILHGILLDVPCSATGTGARRPDVLRRSSDLKELLQIQELLANHCADNILSEGGILVYATCSILKVVTSLTWVYDLDAKEESEDQVTKLIARGKQNSKHASMTTLPIHPSEVPGFESAIDENGWLRILPGVLEGDLRSADGFFVARLIKEDS